MLLPAAQHAGSKEYKPTTVRLTQARGRSRRVPERKGSNCWRRRVVGTVIIALRHRRLLSQKAQLRDVSRAT
jgi:hypothetical protein